jgi:hypothetical protein
MNSNSQVIMFDDGEYSASQHYYARDDVNASDDSNRTQKQQQQQQQHECSGHDDRLIASMEKPTPPPPSKSNNSSTEEYNSSTSTSTSTSNNEYERLLSSTIISLADKLFVGRAASSSGSFNGGGRSRRSSSIEIPCGRSKVNDNCDDDEEDGARSKGDHDMMDIIESQSSLTLGELELHSSFERERCQPQEQQQQQRQQQQVMEQQVIEEKATPKGGNLKTTGLDDCWNTAPIDNQVSTRQHDHYLRGQDYYLPQSAAILLNTLQNISNLNNNGSNNNGTTNDGGGGGGGTTRGMDELLAMLKSSALSSSGSGVMDVGGEMFDHDEDDDNEDGCASKPDINNNNSYNDDDDDDDDYSLNGDMARLSKSIASLQRDLDNIDLSQFDDMYGDDAAGEGGGGSSSGNTEQELLLDALHEDIGDGRRRGVAISKKWKRWIRNWLLSRGLINDDKVVNSLLGDDGDDRDRGVYALPTTMVDGEGGEGFRIFDFEVDHILVLTLLLVFFVLLYHRFKTAADYF